MTKILVVYYSWSGNTKTVGEQIRQITGSDLFEIEPVEAYPVNYNTCIDQAKREIAAGHKPALKNRVENIGQYETVFLGSPVWWHTIAPPVATFLSEYDFSDKEIAPFCTHGGGGLSKCAVDIGKMAPKATILEAVALWGNKVGASQMELADWLHRIEIK